jgi:hypothetical protein
MQSYVFKKCVARNKMVANKKGPGIPDPFLLSKLE